MHIYFSGIGGTGIGPLALIAKQAGYTVSGSDKQNSLYIEYLRKHGITDVHIGQTAVEIAKVHAEKPIDWFVYSSALPKENPDHPELVFCEKQNIKHSKRDELLNEILTQKNLKLIAIAGTHGKSTTTAMTIWLFKQLGIPVSYSVGAKLSYGEMGEYDPKSEYFVYECDEYDRNFLAFKPYMSIITGVSWDHNDVFPTKEDYQQAFRDFITQSIQTVIWRQDMATTAAITSGSYRVTSPELSLESLNQISLLGLVNRMDAWLAVTAMNTLTNEPIEKLISIINDFPGLARRFEKLATNIYTDYAHTAEKIHGAVQMASEANDSVVVVYEGLHNRRQHFMREQGQFADLFKGVKKLYWVPSYLAREDPNQQLLSPSDLIPELKQSVDASPANLDDELLQHIKNHSGNNDLVLLISAGGGGSLDEWARANLV